MRAGHTDTEGTSLDGRNPAADNIYKAPSKNGRMEDSPRQLMKNLINRSLTSIDPPRHFLCLQRTAIQNHQVKSRCLELFSLASTAFLTCVGLLHQMLRSSTFTLASIFVVLQLAPQFLFEKNTCVDVWPVEESDGRTWTYHQPP